MARERAQLALLKYCHSRVCPGRYVAVQSMWAAMACILSTIRITNAKDEHGNSIAVVPEFTTGTVMCVFHDLAPFIAIWQRTEVMRNHFHVPLKLGLLGPNSWSTKADCASDPASESIISHCEIAVVLPYHCKCIWPMGIHICTTIQRQCTKMTTEAVQNVDIDGDGILFDLRHVRGRATVSLVDTLQR